MVESLKTPYYIFDEGLFIDNLERFKASFQSVYSNYHIAYSFKTNYSPYIVRLIKKAGCYAEVVSDMEYALARRLGFENKEIIYNGPYKGALLEEHLSRGGIVNVDNFEECTRICHFAKQNFREGGYRIGLRMNLNLGAGFISRFGMEDGSKLLLNCLQAIKACGNLRVVGLHCHIKAPRDPESWRKRSEIMIAAADKYIEGIPEFFSLGSGMVPGRYDQYAEEYENYSPGYSDYAIEVFSPFINRYPENHRPIVFTEPGRALITRYIRFFAAVDNIKIIQNRNMATTDGSFHNLGEISTLARVPIIVHHNSAGKYYDKIDIMGYTCLEQDVMFPDYSGEVAVGDIIEFRNAGGYSIVYKPQFICPQCAMYVLHSDGSAQKIMREESFEDIFAKFV